MKIHTGSFIYFISLVMNSLYNLWETGNFYYDHFQKYYPCMNHSVSDRSKIFSMADGLLGFCSFLTSQPHGFKFESLPNVLCSLYYCILY